MIRVKNRATIVVGIAWIISRLASQWSSDFCRGVWICAFSALAFVAITHPSTGTLFRPSEDEPLRPGDVLITAGDVMAIGRLQDQARGMRAAA